MLLQLWIRHLEPQISLWRSKHGHLASAHSTEVHVVHRGDPEPHGIGELHVEVGLLDEVQFRLHQVSSPHHCVLQHHEVQGQHRGPHVLLQLWIRHLEPQTNLWKHGHLASAHSTEVHVVHREDPEPHCVGGLHAEVGLPDEVKFGLHQVP